MSFTDEEVERLFAVRGAADDVDPALGEELGHGLEHRGVIVRDDARDVRLLSHLASPFRVIRASQL